MAKHESESESKNVSVNYSPMFKGRTAVPGDKSLSHRALILAALADGLSEITGLSNGDDVLSTVRCLRQLGIKIELGDTTFVTGRGLRGFQQPVGDLDCGNSGTTMRLLMGCLVGQNFSSTLIGDDSLSARPMARVANPLRNFGANIALTRDNFAPVHITGTADLESAELRVDVASAQVKSALVLASLFGKTATRIAGKLNSRDHTERLLPYFGADLHVGADAIVTHPTKALRPVQFAVPGDPSSAAFLVAAAVLAPSGDITIDNVALNPTRTGFYRILERMGASIQLKETSNYPEPIGTIAAQSAQLKGTIITPAEVPSVIDELPLIAVIAAFASGVTEVRGAEELRLKESDRIEAVAENLRAIGAHIETFPDGFRIQGGTRLHAAAIDSHGDHRIAMAFAIAALSINGATTIKDAQCADISFKNFFDVLNRLSKVYK